MQKTEHVLASIAFHIETSHLFYRAKQMTGFYMKHNTAEWLKSKVRLGPCETFMMETFFSKIVF